MVYIRWAFSFCGIESFRKVSYRDGRGSMSGLKAASWTHLLPVGRWAIRLRAFLLIRIKCFQAHICRRLRCNIKVLYRKMLSVSKKIALLTGYITRVFAPKFGYLEDPATGSGNSAFAYYMLQYDLWDRRDILIEQGGYNQIYNGVRISYCDGSVLFGGSATIRICGKYCI